MKAVIFDLGRVLVHYDHQKTVATTADLWHVTHNHLQPLMQEVSAALGAGAMDAEMFHALLCTRLGQTPTFADFITAYAAGIQRDEEALAYALALQQRPDTTVAIMSNTNAAHVLWLDEHLPELREFDLVMMSNEVGVLKPEPAIFALALELLDVPPEQTIFIDDIAANVDAARGLGMAGIVHSDWSTTHPALEQWLETA